MANPLSSRAAGLLLHPTSLPGPHAIGDVGRSARAFVDFLERAGLGLWQILPLVPPGGGASPYSSRSAFAGNTLLVDLEGLVDDGLLERDDLPPPAGDADRMDIELATKLKGPALEKAARRVLSAKKGERAFALCQELDAFLERHPWAAEYGLFVALKRRHEGRAFWEWEPALRDREPAALERARKELDDEVRVAACQQLLFERQWQSLRAYANGKGVKLIGDVPLYVDADSVDVWTHRRSFLVDDQGRRLVLAGAPPDPFSDVGQLWGNPIYDWKYLKETGHAFWVERMRRAFEQTDIVRIDHFRGFAAYWEIPVGAPDARAGRWVEGPGRAIFDDLERALGSLPLIAEDLGVITDDVVALLDELSLPGMKVLQFAFGEDWKNPYLPHNHVENAAVYTGTHDTNTVVGWWNESPEHVKDHARRYLGTGGSDIAWDLIRAAFASVAKLAIVPMQDALSLDAGARMNVPGQAEGNWTWRVRAEAFNDAVAGRLAETAWLYGRRQAG